jgi:hypothetical protein
VRPEDEEEEEEGEAVAVEAEVAEGKRGKVEELAAEAEGNFARRARMEVARTELGEQMSHPSVEGI